MDVGAGDRLDRVGDRLGVAGVGGVDREVHDQPVMVGLDDVDGGHGARGLAHRGRDAADAEGSDPMWTRIVIEYDALGTLILRWLLPEPNPSRPGQAAAVPARPGTRAGDAPARRLATPALALEEAYYLSASAFPALSTPPWQAAPARPSTGRCAMFGLELLAVPMVSIARNDWIEIYYGFIVCPGPERGSPT